MRKLAALVALSLLFSFTCGYLLIVVQQSLRQTTKPELISSELRRFLSEEKPDFKIVFDEYDDELLNPSLALPQTVRYAREDLLALEKFQNDCNAKPGKISPSLSKAVQFYTIICSHKSFSEGFFSKKPYFLPTGQSFSAAAMQNGYKLDEISRYLHITERASAGLDVSQKVFSDFQWKNWSQIYARNRVVLTSKWALVRANYIEDDITYSVFPIEKWDGFWKHTAFKASLITPETRAECFSVTEGACWSVNYLKAMQYQRGPQIAGLFVVLIATVVLFVLLLLEVINQRRDNRKIKFSLDMLTHELRTPLTQLNFNIEKMRQQFDELPVSSQMSVLDIMNQAQRLNLLARNSTHYLSDTKANYFKIQPSEIGDMKAYVEHSLDLYLDDINLSWDIKKTDFKIDLYWFGVCMKNIVENAVKHGEKPIQVRVTLRYDLIAFEVQDAGVFKEKPKAEASSESGLGLGLNLVRQIMQQLGGELEITTGPTAVVIKVRRNHEK